MPIQRAENAISIHLLCSKNQLRGTLASASLAGLPPLLKHLNLRSNVLYGFIEDILSALPTSLEFLSLVSHVLLRGGGAESRFGAGAAMSW